MDTRNNAEVYLCSSSTTHWQSMIRTIDYPYDGVSHLSDVDY